MGVVLHMSITVTVVGQELWDLPACIVKSARSLLTKPAPGVSEAHKGV